ncbi:hypothetical protein THAOC_13689 [Thalassiosira oceanica]|uniref:Uncharacterized protein n=1 Tax=Thalassiosira oceanica TaxID=159749 RepID=K0SJB7_THAOC|nr:hypothetical protein THAOC_13689 [Thalassiosira oceanica]|eukprot:EJK65445.1 hypothetical protein THAOC_13689 [Thalassiosira oceanica]
MQYIRGKRMLLHTFAAVPVVPAGQIVVHQSAKTRSPHNPNPAPGGTGGAKKYYNPGWPGGRGKAPPTGPLDGHHVPTGTKRPSVVASIYRQGRYEKEAVVAVFQWFWLLVRAGVDGIDGAGGQPGGPNWTDALPIRPSKLKGRVRQMNDERAQSGNIGTKSSSSIKHGGGGQDERTEGHLYSTHRLDSCLLLRISQNLLSFAEPFGLVGDDNGPGLEYWSCQHGIVLALPWPLCQATGGLRRPHGDRVASAPISGNRGREPTGRGAGKKEDQAISGNQVKSKGPFQSCMRVDPPLKLRALEARPKSSPFDYDTKPKHESKAREIGRVEETEMMGNSVEDLRTIDLDLKCLP